MVDDLPLRRPQRATCSSTSSAQHGYTRVMNLTGGMQRWAREVDPSIQRWRDASERYSVRADDLRPMARTLRARRTAPRSTCPVAGPVVEPSMMAMPQSSYCGDRMFARWPGDSIHDCDEQRARSRSRRRGSPPAYAIVVVARRQPRERRACRPATSWPQYASSSMSRMRSPAARGQARRRGAAAGGRPRRGTSFIRREHVRRR